MKKGAFMTVSTADTSTFVRDTWEAFSWRMMSNYVSPWEHDRLRERISDWDEWCSAWSDEAAGHMARADKAAAAGHGRPAAAADTTAGPLNNRAGVLFTHDAAQSSTPL